MENNLLVDEPQGSAMSVALKYGTIGGLGLIVLSLVMFLTGMESIGEGKTSWISSLFNYGIMISAIVLAITYHKTNNLGGTMSFGDAFKTGFMTTLIMSVFSAVWMVVFFSIIDPEAIELIRELALEQMEDQGMDDDAAEAAASMMDTFTSIPFFTLMGFLGTFFVGTIISLIGAAVLKNEKVDYA